MNIAYFNYEWDLRESSGAATHIREFTRAMRALGHRVTVYDRHRNPTTDADPSVSGKHVNGTTGVRQRLAPYLHETAALTRAMRGLRIETTLVRRARPDVVLTRYSMHQFSSLVAARRYGVPIVLEVNAPLAFEYRRYRPEYRLVPRFGEWTEKRLLSLADAVIVVSNPLKEYFVERGLPADYITVIPNGVDTDRFEPNAAFAHVRGRFPEGSVIVGFIGSFASFHGVELLRHAIDLLAAERPQSAFLMVGKGKRGEELQTYCETRNFAHRVVFTGFVAPHEVPGHAAAADILIVPYAAEKFFYFSPIKLFEYMACGRAILASKVGQVAEVIRDGENGLLYDPNDLRTLDDGLLRLIDDPQLRERLGANARATAKTQYTWHANAERVSEVLKRACTRHLGRHT